VLGAVAADTARDDFTPVGDEVLQRLRVLVVDQDVQPDARPTEVTDETWTKAAETAADEEEIMTGQATRSPFFEDEEDDIDPDAEEEALRKLAAENATEDDKGDKGAGGQE